MNTATIIIPSLGPHQVRVDYCHQDYLDWIDQMLAEPSRDRYLLRPCRTGTIWREGGWHLVTEADDEHPRAYHPLTPELGTLYRQLVAEHLARSGNPIPQYDGVGCLSQITGPNAHLVETVCDGDRELEVLELTQAACRDTGAAMADVIVAHSMSEMGVLRARTVAIAGHPDRPTIIAPVAILESLSLAGGVSCVCWQLYIMMPDRTRPMTDRGYLGAIAHQDIHCQICTIDRGGHQTHYWRDCQDWTPISLVKVLKMRPQVLVYHPDLPPFTVPRLVTLYPVDDAPVLADYLPQHEYTPRAGRAPHMYSIQVWASPSRAKSARAVVEECVE